MLDRERAGGDVRTRKSKENPPVLVRVATQLRTEGYDAFSAHVSLEVRG